jgi:6-phosphogluconolactonase
LGITTDVTGSDVYMPNNDATINGYAIDNATGELTNIKGSPFSGSGGTLGIAADRSGKFLYVANQADVLGYRINSSNGALTELSGSPFGAGFIPIAVCVAGVIK